MKKRIAALLLCLVMAMGLIPTTALAAGLGVQSAEDGISAAVDADQQAVKDEPTDEGKAPEQEVVQPAVEEPTDEEKTPEQPVNQPVENEEENNTAAPQNGLLDAEGEDAGVSVEANWKPDDLITITVDVLDTKTDKTYSGVATVTCRKGDKYIQSDRYSLPNLKKLCPNATFGKIEKITGNWYWPGTLDGQVGMGVYWSCNADTGRMTYYVNGFTPGGSSGGGTTPATEGIPVQVVYKLSASKYDLGDSDTLPYSVCETKGTKHSHGKNCEIKRKCFAPDTLNLNIDVNFDLQGFSIGKNPDLYTREKSFNGTVEKWQSGEKIYLVYSLKKPNPNDFQGLVNIECTPVEEHQASCGVIGLAGTGSLTGSDGYYYINNINAQLYINEVNSGSLKDEFGNKKHVQDTTKKNQTSITFTWNAKTYTWEVTPAVIYVKCDTTTPGTVPGKPGNDEIEALVNAVKVNCVSQTAHVERGYSLKMAYCTGAADVTTVTNNGVTEYFYDVTVNDPAGVTYYIGEYVKDTGNVAHEEQDTSAVYTVRLKYVPASGTTAATWVVANSATVKVTCDEEENPITPPTGGPDYGAFKELVSVICDSTVNHIDKTKTYAVKDEGVVKDATAGTPKIEEVTDPATGKITGYKWVVTINKDYYVDKYKDEVSDNHTYKKSNSEDLTIQFNWDGSTWTVDNNDNAATVYVECTAKLPTVTDLANIKVIVTDESTVHSFEKYALKTGSYDAKLDTTGNECTITVKAKMYVDEFNTANGTHTGVNVDDKTVKMVKDANGVWSVEGESTVEFTVKCKPDTTPDLAQFTSLVKVECRGVGSHSVKSQTYGLIDGTYTGNYEHDGNNWIYRITLNASAENDYIGEFNKNVAEGHTLDANGAAFARDITWLYTKGNWELSSTVTIPVVCAPAAPTADQLKNLVSVRVRCADKDTEHARKTFALADGQFNTKVEKVGNEYICTLTLKEPHGKYYVGLFDSKSHSLKNIEDDTVKLVWVPEVVIYSLPTTQAVAVPGHWELYTDGNNQDDGIFKVVATCNNGGGTTPPGGNNIGPAKNPYIKDEPKTVQSGKTFDAGIALYVGLGILSMTGGAVVIRKKKEF